MQNFYYYIVGLAFCSYFLSMSMKAVGYKAFIHMLADMTATIGMVGVFVLLIMSFWHAPWWHVILVGLVSLGLPGVAAAIFRQTSKLPILINIILYIGVFQFAFMAVMNMFGRGF